MVDYNTSFRKKSYDLLKVSLCSLKVSLLSIVIPSNSNVSVSLITIELICNKVKLKINSIVISKSDSVELLGISIDNKLTFNEHINNLCRNASYRLYALRRIRKYLTQDQAKCLHNAFINSQFNYAPVIWMFCRKNQYLKIQQIHHKALKDVSNSVDGYDELLQMNNEITIHQKHLHALINEVFKSLNNSNPEFMWFYFTFNSQIHKIYVLRH